MAMLGCSVKLDEADDYYTPETLRANFQDPTCVCWCKGDKGEHGRWAEVIDGRFGGAVPADVAASFTISKGGVEGVHAAVSTPAPLGAPSRFSKVAMLRLCSAALAASGGGSETCSPSFAQYRQLKDQAVAYQCAKDVLFSEKTPFQHWCRRDK
jgi:hypothetical protein